MIKRTDVYIIALGTLTLWFLWDVVNIITLGPVFKILGSDNTFAYTALLLVLVAITYIIFAILGTCLKYIQQVFSGSDETETAAGKKVASVLPYFLALIPLYIILLLIQTLWYMVNGY